MCPRTEETPNKIEFSGAYSLALLDKMQAMLPDARSAIAQLRHDHVQDAKMARFRCFSVVFFLKMEHVLTCVKAGHQHQPPRRGHFPVSQR